MTENVDKAEVIAIREAIDAYILKNLKKKGPLLQDEREKWLMDIAEKLEEIHLATHVLKVTHTSAKGTNILDEGYFCKEYVCTLNSGMKYDVAYDNAAYMGAAGFLLLEIGGLTLYERLCGDDSLLFNALGGSEKIKECLNVFKQIKPDSIDSASSHRLAKQMYWPLNEGGYHLLSPLFPTSLVQRVYEKLSEDRFGEKTKTAREAKKNSEYHEQGYCDYPDLLLQRYDGKNKNNVGSRLTFNRGTETWLLCAMPPLWKSETLRVPLYAETVFGGILRKQTHLHKKIKALVDFLKATDSYTNVNIRDGRTERVSHIIDEVLQWSFQVGEQVGWSRDPNCRLIEAEICWLDPVRAQEDELPLCKDGSWANIVSDRFAHWFNAQLSHLGLTMSDQEYEVWKQTFLEALNAA